jgi:predicted esterase
VKRIGLLLFATIAVVVGIRSWKQRGSAAAPPAAPADGVAATRPTNSSGRTGAWFAPASRDAAAVPLLVLLHGTGGSGRQILGRFIAQAKARGFAIVAPDSRQVQGAWTWEVGDKPGEVTEDLNHVIATVEWVTDSVNLQVDLTRVLIAGYSGGASSAPYIGTNRRPFTQCAVLHGGAFPGGLGTRRIPCWFSTGNSDPARPPAGVYKATSQLQALGFTTTYRTFAGAHELTDPEIDALISWWLER